MGRHVKIPKNYGASRIALRRFRDAVSKDRKHDAAWREKVTTALDAVIGYFIEADARLSGAGADSVRAALRSAPAKTSARGRPPKVRVSYTNDALWLNRMLDAITRDERQPPKWRRDVAGELRTAIIQLHASEMASHRGIVTPHVPPPDDFADDADSDSASDSASAADADADAAD